ncbi:ATP-binding protein [Planomicrobium sp. CPCC 101079]|uniref:ATP-binding protein n=1 Tax=Planomicrobium sp. CPCC 101079 TaxID=2599618 RepID=UPI0011B3C504|nr:ATP-binding protein [Planomicrobium sp. CPCC 101079]TWT00129.1 ATP-binding protein [Planomicrobium sp. CPCC 101079]
MKVLQDGLNQIIENLRETYGESGPGVYTKPSKKCAYNRCDGSGFILFLDENKNSAMRECNCFKQKEVIIKLKSAKVPEKFLNCTVADFSLDLYEEEEREVAKSAKHIASKFVQNYEMCKERGKGLYFYSQITGSGKSRLAISIGNDLVKRLNISFLYIPSSNAIDELKETFGDKSEHTMLQVLDVYKKVELLIIDDLGVENNSDWSEGIFTQILEERMNSRKLTIITSNIKIEELSHIYKRGRIKSRIDYMTFPIDMPEEDIREKESIQKNKDIFNDLFNN